MTTAFTPDTPVGRIVAEDPGAARVLERLGIDYCCGGKRPLRDACAAKSLEPANVLSEIAGARGSGPPVRDWSRAPLAELCDHIEATHHAALKVELPRVAEMFRKVINAHGERHPEIISVAEVFESFADELVHHMQKEERMLFPALRELEKSGHGQVRQLDAPIACLMREHDDAGTALAKMHEMTNGYTPPPDACTTFRVLLASLKDMEADMHQHVHKENNILFPAAIERMGAPCRCSVEP